MFRLAAILYLLLPHVCWGQEAKEELRPIPEENFKLWRFYDFTSAELCEVIGSLVAYDEKTNRISIAPVDYNGKPMEGIRYTTRIAHLTSRSQWYMKRYHKIVPRITELNPPRDWPMNRITHKSCRLLGVVTAVRRHAKGRKGAHVIPFDEPKVVLRSEIGKAVPLYPLSAFSLDDRGYINAK